MRILILLPLATPVLATAIERLLPAGSPSMVAGGAATSERR